MLRESFLSDIFPVVFAFKFYHLRDEVRPLQSLSQCGSACRHVEHASSRRIHMSVVPARPGMKHFDVFNTLCFLEAGNPFAAFGFAGIFTRDQNDCRSGLLAPIDFQRRKPMFGTRNKDIRKIGLQPKRRTVIVFDGPTGLDMGKYPIAADCAEQFYFKPESGRVLASPADETPVEPQDVQPEEIDIALVVDRVEQASTLKVERMTVAGA